VGSIRYEWVGVSAKKSFVDGRPSSVDSHWGATGEVTRDGQTLGRYRMQTELVGRQAGGFIRFVLALTDGGTVELERWNAY